MKFFINKKNIYFFNKYFHYFGIMSKKMSLNLFFILIGNFYIFLFVINLFITIFILKIYLLILRNAKRNIILCNCKNVFGKPGK